jgi:axial budding pattern protein 2
MKLIIASFWIAMSTGTPQIAFPFNSQVPEIARVRKPYFFDLSPSTFRTETGPLSFSLSKAPQWLQIDNRNGTLYGLPGDGDAGAPQFIILASDLTGSAPMQATLVVSNEIGPQLHTDIANSLVDIGGRCGLRCLEVSPSTQLQFQFPLDSFTISSSPTFYYATLQDHTPLPAWLQFDRSILQFTGQTPQIGNMAQNLDINLIASDVLGFAAAATSFSIIVSSHRLMFDTLSQIQNISSGQPFSISNLRSHLYLDSALISDTDYAGATVGGPSWLNLDTQSLSLSGIPPNTSTSVNVTIDAQDRYGDTAFMTILLNLGYTPLFIGHIGMLNATAGKEFSYQLSKSDFTQNDVVITVNLAQLSNWLHFDPQTLTIQGTIPWNMSSQILDGNITVTKANGSERDFQQFEIDVGM